MSKTRTGRLGKAKASLGAALLVAGTGLAWAQANQAQPPSTGEVRALVIGIDHYRTMPQLKGAASDALDLEATLKRNGVKDITALLDAQADRAGVIGKLEELLSRSRSGDLVILTIAGHGSQEPERVKGSQPDGLENVFLLPGFDPASGEGSRQRILGAEFNHFIKAFEARGVRVLFVADACHGGGLTRQIDPRAAQMTYREAPRYSLTSDELKPVASTNDAYLSEMSFKKTTFLAAVDRNSKAPEVRVPGVDGYRGALSYAVARALDGAADQNNDGQVTQAELFGYVQQVAYQLSDQRQNVVTVGRPPAESDSDVMFSRTRAVIMLDAPGARPSSSQPPATALTPGPSAPKAPAAAASAASPAARPEKPLDAVRIAVLSNQRELLKGLERREVKFDVVGTNENPDLVWDASTFDVLARGDVIARSVDLRDLPSVIDRFAAVSGFKRLSAAAPQTVRVTPDDKVHRRETRLDVQVSDVAQRALLMFNIAGDGTVQALYPFGSDLPVIATADYKFPVVVGEPFGADQVVAITSSQRMVDLEQALKKMNQRRAAVEFYRIVERYAPSDARVGFTTLYSAP